MNKETVRTNCSDELIHIFQNHTPPFYPIGLRGLRRCSLHGRRLTGRLSTLVWPDPVTASDYMLTGRRRWMPSSTTGCKMLISLNETKAGCEPSWWANPCRRDAMWRRRPPAQDKKWRTPPPRFTESQTWILYTPQLLRLPLVCVCSSRTEEKLNKHARTKESS